MHAVNLQAVPDKLCIEFRYPHPINIASKTMNSAGNLYMEYQEWRSQGFLARYGRGAITRIISFDQDQVMLLLTSGAVLWNLSSNQADWEIDGPSVIGEVSSNGRFLAIADLQQIYIWDLAKNSLLQTIYALDEDRSMGRPRIRQLWFPSQTSKEYSLAISDDGDVCALIKDVQDKRFLRSWKLGNADVERLVELNDIWYAKVSANTDALACFAQGNQLQVWDRELTRKLMQVGLPQEFWLTDINRDGKWAVCYSLGGKTLFAWEVLSHRQALGLYAAPSESFRFVGFGDHDVLIVERRSGSQSSIECWNLQTGQRLATVVAEHSLQGYAYQHEQGRLIGHDASALYIWDTTDRKPMTTWQITSKTVKAISCSNKGQKISVADEHSVQVIDSVTGNSIFEATSEAPILTICIDSLGEKLAVAGKDKSLCIYQINHQSLLAKFSIDLAVTDVKRYGRSNRKLLEYPGYLVMDDAGNRVAYCLHGKVQAWDIRDARLLHESELTDIQNLTREAVTSWIEPVKDDDSPSGKEVLSPDGSHRCELFENPKESHVLLDSKLIALTRTAKPGLFKDAEIGWLKWSTSDVMSAFPMDVSVDGVRFSRDSSLLAIGAAPIVILNVQTAKLLRQANALDSVLEFAPDNSRLLTSDGYCLRLWGLE
jgi:WD40 repeat protein